MLKRPVGNKEVKIVTCAYHTLLQAKLPFYLEQSNTRLTSYECFIITIGSTYTISMGTIVSIIANCDQVRVLSCSYLRYALYPRDH